MPEVNLFILAINCQNIIYFITNYISKAALFFGQINYLFSLFELLFSCMETLKLCSLSAMNYSMNLQILLHLMCILEISNLSVSFLYTSLVILYSEDEWDFASIYLLLFNSTFCITNHTTHIHYNHKSKCLIFSYYAAEILSTYHQSLYLFHKLKKHTRDKY